MLQNELSIFEQSNTKEQCQDAINTHNNIKNKIYSINIEPLLNEGRLLVKQLTGVDLILEVSSSTSTLTSTTTINSPGTRDSGYSAGSSNDPLTSNSNEANNKFNLINDYFNESNKIRDHMEQLKTSKQKIQNLWQQKKLKLEQALQLKIFEYDFNQV